MSSVPAGIEIRTEQSEDHASVRRVNELAFGQRAEADLVEALRAGGHARLSLVAEEAGEIVGHVLFSDLPIVDGIRTIPALALAPLAVVPERQRRGVGSALVREGLRRSAESGYEAVVVLGHPAYYPRFGFSAQLAAHLAAPYAGEAFMAAELVPGALAGVAGAVRYPPPFDGV